VLVVRERPTPRKWKAGVEPHERVAQGAKVFGTRIGNQVDLRRGPHEAVGGDSDAADDDVTDALVVQRRHHGREVGKPLTAPVRPAPPRAGDRDGAGGRGARSSSPDAPRRGDARAPHRALPAPPRPPPLPPRGPRRAPPPQARLHALAGGAPRASAGRVPPPPGVTSWVFITSSPYRFGRDASRRQRVEREAAGAVEARPLGPARAPEALVGSSAPVKHAWRAWRIGFPRVGHGMHETVTAGSVRIAADSAAPRPSGVSALRAGRRGRRRDR